MVIWFDHTNDCPLEMLEEQSAKKGNEGKNNGKPNEKKKKKKRNSALAIAFFSDVVKNKLSNI